ncbi:MAG TPA: hypothetical protein VFJ49_06590, partial [Methyloceanibacter sp.]|nr:hypothetical protein [Methyloceanibacter sp.]
MQGARRSAKPGAKVTRRSEPKLGPRSPGRQVRPRPQRKGRKPSRLKLALANRPLLYKSIRLALLSLIWGTIVLGAAVVYFISRVPDPIIAALDDRPPNVTILAADGTVLAER